MENQEQTISFNEYLRILKRGKWIVIAAFVVVFLSTIFFTYTIRPVYQATAMIMVKQDGGVQHQLFDAPSMPKGETLINNHVEILKSRSLAKNVIHSLQNSPYADTLWILRKRSAHGRFSVIDLLSRFKLLRAQKNPVNLSDEEVYIRQFSGVISILPKRDTDIIELRVESPSAFEASLIANAWMEAYQDLDIQASRGEMSETRRFLDEKVKDIQKTLGTAEEALKVYKETHGVTELSGETQQMIRQLAEFEAQYQGAKTQLEANQKRLDHLKSQLDESQRIMLDKATQFSSPVVQELQRQLAQLVGEQAAYEQQLRGAGYSTAGDFKLQNMEQRIVGLKQKIADETRKIAASGAPALDPIHFSEGILNSILEIETENKSLMAKADILRRILDELNAAMNTMPEKSLQLARLSREAEVNNNIFLMLREKYEESRIAEAGQVGSVRIVDYADPPKQPIKPRKKTNLILGMLVGFGIVLLKEYLDTKIHASEDVERLGYTVLSAIPKIPAQRVKRPAPGTDGKLMQIESRLITHFASNSSVAEAYRTLRTHVQFANVDKPVKTILITSPGPGDGKSTSATNLAITFAQTGAKTLLVDTDLRRPVLHSILGHTHNEGLTNVLVGKIPLDQTIRPTRIRNLFLLTSGTLPRNPSEFLASRVMQKLIHRISSLFTVILFDSPPIIAVTDAAVLATKMDGTVIVVKADRTDRDALVQSQNILKKVNARIFGTVVNGLSADRRYGYYYDYYSNT